MTRKKVAVLLAMVLFAAAAVVTSIVVWSLRRPLRLVNLCPSLASSELFVGVQATAWPTQTETSVDMGTDFQYILRDAWVTKGVKTDQGPDVGMLIHVKDYLGDANGYPGEVTYSIEVGQDGFVSVARTDDLEGTRTYWKDKDGDLFDKLYQCYLQNGGEEIQ